MSVWDSYIISRGLVNENIMIILWYFFLFLHKTICCGNSLEVHQWDTSNERPQHVFFMEKLRKLSQSYVISRVLVKKPASVAPSDAFLTGDQEVTGSPSLGPATFFHGDWSRNIFYGHSLPSADSRRAVVSFWWKNAQVLVNCLED